MGEMVAEVKTLTVEMMCDKCNNGLMKRDGYIVLSTDPPKYPHKCSNCGNMENYPIVYPYQILVPIEELRERREDEK